MLEKLNRNMQHYFAAMQVKLPPATIRKITRKLQNESLMEEELHCLQHMCSQISFDNDNDNEDSSDTDDESSTSDSSVDNSKKKNIKQLKYDTNV